MPDEMRRECIRHQRVATVTTVLFGPFGLAAVLLPAGFMATLAIDFHNHVAAQVDKPCPQTASGCWWTEEATSAPLPTFVPITLQQPWWDSSSTSDAAGPNPG